MYSQTKVTISPNPAYHSMYFGAPELAPFSIVLKSSIRLSAATTTIIMLMTIPICQLAKRKLLDACVNRPMMKLTR